MASNSESALGLLNLFLGRTNTQTQTQRTSTSKAGVKAATDQVLAQIMPGAANNQQAAGGFGSSSYALAAGEAAAKAGAYAEELNKEVSTTTTNKQGAAIDPRVGLALFAGNAFMNTDTGKKAKDWLSTLFSGDSVGGEATNVFSNLSSGGNTAPGGSDGVSLGSIIPSLFEDLDFRFADGGKIILKNKPKADGGTIQGDPSVALQQMLSYIQQGTKGFNFGTMEPAPLSTGNQGAFESSFQGYGDKVDRNFGKEFANFLKIGQSILTANPVGLAAGATSAAKMDAQNRMLQGFAEGDADGIQAAASQISQIQGLQDAAGTLGKVKSVYDTATGFGGLTDAFTASDSTSAQALISAVAADQVYGMGKNINDIADTISGSSSSSSDSSSPDSSGNYTYSRYGGSTDTTRADGGYLGGLWQMDTKGVDRIKGSNGVRLGGGEFIIPQDVVSKLSPQFFEDLLARFHTPVRG